MEPIHYYTTSLDQVVVIEGHLSGSNTLQLKSHLTMASNHKWTPDDTIKVWLFGGIHYIQRMVKTYARLWLKYADLDLESVDYGDADIYVSSSSAALGSWSAPAAGSPQNPWKTSQR